MAKGKKFDEKKNPLELISAAAEWALGEVLKHGRRIYDAWNWEDGLEYSRIIGAIKRHRNAIEAGEDYDKDSGLLHSAHLFCEAMFLLHFQLMGREDLDDRRVYTGPPKVKITTKDVQEMIDAVKTAEPGDYLVPQVTNPPRVMVPINGCSCAVCDNARKEGKSWELEPYFQASPASSPASSEESTKSVPPTKSD